MGNYRVENRQFTHALIAAITVDGSSVGATYGVDGLDNGQHIAQILKSGAVFTIKFRKTFGIAPQVFIQPHTLDCNVRKTGGDKETLELTTYDLSGGAGTGNEDFTVFIFGTEGIVEGGR